MILDYNYSKNTKELTISYINKEGRKDFLNFENINRFKTYYYTPTGQYETYDGARAGIKYTDDPSKFDLKEYIMELPQKYKDLINEETFPRLYTWDIEVMQSADGTYSEASVADNAITTISVVSPELDCIVLGWRELSDKDIEYCKKEFVKYIEANEFFKTLEMKTPSFKYVKFATEKAMLEYFLNIVSKAPVMAGWNSIKYDWQYVVNRLKNHYPDISINKSSYTKQVKMKNHTSTIGKEKIRLPMPLHTLMVDMMAVIEEDKVVMPIKESLGLDYIAQESVAANKIKYKKSLGDLYNTDYRQYVFYNCIDSILVQLINYKFRTIDKFYIYGHYCTEKLDACFGKIALTEAMVFKDFYKHGLKIVYKNEETPDRGKLVGAYVREPSPGKYYYICCNDFASLYPSTIITCNISFENYVGAYYDEEKLAQYKNNPKYVVIGAAVYINDGSAEKPTTGEYVGTFLNDKELEKFRQDPNYFVSVNGHVYKNDKEYTFKRIQRNLKAERNIFKYLAKKLDAGPISDIDHIKNGHLDKLGKYDKQVQQYMIDNGFGAITCGKDLIGKTEEEYLSITTKINRDIVYYTAKEKALKNLGNSMYGGCSHVSFYWYNMNIANDITGEARNLIHRMEKHIPEYFQQHWADMDDLHKKMGITVDKEKCKTIPELCKPVYGDSCDGETLISTSNGNIKISKLFDEAHTVYHDRGKEFAISDVKVLNFNGKEYIENKVKFIIRHKTSKEKWEIFVNNSSVIVTGDHSMITIKNGKLIETKPRDVVVGDEMVTTSGIYKVDNIKLLGNFDNEYVYDISVDTTNKNEQNFFGNGILIHNTDSVQADTIIQTEDGKITIEEFFNKNYNNQLTVTHKGHELVKTNTKVLNWTNDNKLDYCGVNYIMRHKVSKPKWRLKTKSGKEIFVTEDHSMIVFRNGKKLEVKPREIQPNDKILSVK